MKDDVSPCVATETATGPQSSEIASGVAILIASGVSLLWASSSWGATCFEFWQTALTVRVNAWSTTLSVRSWIDHGLMTILALQIGYLLQSEYLRNAARGLRIGRLFLAAAIGGATASVIAFRAANMGHPIAEGWEIPIADDVVLTYAVFALLGSVVPRAATILVLGVAVVQSFVANTIAEIHLRTGMDPVGCAAIGFGITALLVLRDLKVRTAWLYFVLTIGLWVAAEHARIHPTLAGLLVGLMAPVDTWAAPQRGASGGLRLLRQHRCHDWLGSEGRTAAPDATAPLRLQLPRPYNWLMHVMLLLSAFANMGIDLTAPNWGHDTVRVVAAMTLAFGFAKPVGAIALMWLLLRCGRADLPMGLTTRHLGVLGFGTSLGLTAAIGVAQQALPSGDSLDMVSLGILMASCVGGLLALAFGSAAFGDRRSALMQPVPWRVGRIQRWRRRVVDETRC